MAHELDQENERHSKMKSHFGDSKLDKSKELNESMTITKQEPDEFERTAKTLGGSQ